ncbi:MAG TPA: hypothetical protein VG734_20545 [Lacunisphaera sp.]|nr:hypothetical protein [Lacunisphaera sp.]
MKRLLTYLLLLGSILGFTINAGADDRWETLRAINWVENPTNHTRVGRFGELGPYQFRAATWRMHTKKSFQLAKQRAAADEVAVAHYEWIKQRLEKAGVDATTFNIAMAWNTGVDNVVNGRAPTASFDYAQRVTNLVHTFKQHASRSAVAAADAPAKETPVQPAKIVAPVIGVVHFNTLPDAPRFEVVDLSAKPAPVVYTDHSPAPVSNPTPFVVGTKATFSPSIILAKLGN